MRCGCAMHQRCGGGSMALGASFRRPGMALSGAHFMGEGATTHKLNNACLMPVCIIIKGMKLLL